MLIRFLIQKRQFLLLAVLLALYAGAGWISLGPETDTTVIISGQRQVLFFVVLATAEFVLPIMALACKELALLFKLLISSAWMWMIGGFVLSVAAVLVLDQFDMWYDNGYGQWFGEDSLAESFAKEGWTHPLMIIPLFAALASGLSKIKFDFQEE